MTEAERFVHELATVVPPLQDLLREHVAEFEELLPHVFMGDVSRFATVTYEECARGSDPACTLLEQLLTVLERAATEGPDDVKNLIGASFVENVAEDMVASPHYRSLLGPTLQRELQGVIETYGY